MARKSADALQRKTEFIREQVCLREEPQPEQETSGTVPKQENKKPYFTTASFYSAANKTSLFCKQTNHLTEECHQSLPREEKRKLLAENMSCFKCTRSNLIARICRTIVFYMLCRGRQAISMCRTEGEERQEPAPTTVQQTATSMMQLVENATSNCVLLPTAIAWVEGDASGDICRVLLNSGSQRTFIITALAERIRAKTLRKRS